MKFAHGKSRSEVKRIIHAGSDVSFRSIVPLTAAQLSELSDSVRRRYAHRVSVIGR